MAPALKKMVVENVRAKKIWPEEVLRLQVPRRTRTRIELFKLEEDKNGVRYTSQLEDKNFEVGCVTPPPPRICSTAGGGVWHRKLADQEEGGSLTLRPTRVCAPRNRPLSVSTQGDQAVALGDVEGAPQTLGTQIKGRDLERQYEVIKKHVTEGHSLTNENWEALDVAWELRSTGIFGRSVDHAG